MIQRDKANGIITTSAMAMVLATTLQKQVLAMKQ